MITDERTSTFIDSISGLNTPFLEELEVKAHAYGIPIIRRATQSLIKFVLADLKPASILEIGTATGFSAIFMATYGGNVHIDTIENYKNKTLPMPDWKKSLILLRVMQSPL